MKRPEIRFLLVAGLIFILLGFLFLLWNLGGLELLIDYTPLIPTLFGLMIIIRFYLNRRKSKARYLFLGYFLFLVSGLVLFANIFWPEDQGPWVARLWPLFLGLTGLSFVPVAFNYRYSKRISLLIPSWVLLVLSFLVLIFSLEWVDIGFAAFVGRWWPVFLLILGGSLVLAYWLHRYASREEG